LLERADIRDEGIERHAQRILHQRAEGRHALGARRRHILLLQLVELMLFRVRVKETSGRPR